MGGSVPDVGAPVPDLGAPVPDLGAPVPDLGAPAPDLGAPVPDVGAPVSDLGAPVPDVGAPAPDLGAPVPDSGPALPDVAGLPPDAGLPPQGSLTPDPGEARLLRDRWGVPHVLAATDRGAGFGLGWAQAEDQAEAVLRAAWRVQGRSTELDGLAALPADRAARLLRLVEHARGGWPGLDPDVQALIQGFVDGFDAHLDAHPDRRPAWAEPLDVAWVVALGQLFFLAPQVHRANAEASNLCSGLEILPLPGMGPAATPGSNAWALAPGRSQSGVALHLADPHLPLDDAWRLYEAHVRGGTFELAGATFLGLPLPVMGRNAHVAWAWTWNEPDHADVYQLGLDPQDPEAYELDGVATPFESELATYRLAEGGEVVEALRWSVHGPVVCGDPGLGWVVAYRLSAWGRAGAAAQLVAMARAQSVAELDAALQGLEVAHFNNVAADVSGHVRYLYNARIPRRREGAEHWRPMDGRRAAEIWGYEDVLPAATLPSVTDPACGFVQNCNNAPWVTTGTVEDPPAGILPPRTALDLTDTARAWRVRNTLGAGGALSLAAVFSLATERRMIPAEPLLPLLDAAWQGWGAERPDGERLAPAVELLADWTGVADAAGLAPTLFWAFAYALFDSPWIPLDVLEETEDELTPARAHELLDALAGGMSLLEQRFGAWRLQWGLVHALQRGARRVPVSSGAYPAVSLMHCTADPLTQEEPACLSGSAYTLLTSMERPPRSWSVSPLGNRDGPDPPWPGRSDELYARGELKPLPFTDADLREHAFSAELLSVPDDL